ncbi:MAG: hypothetical protein IJZ64_01515, partial [Ruminococcus sp.]|nr:hypothetical protein [Ruminococcus sp.]
TYEQQYLQPQKQNINNNTSDKQFSADDIEMLIRAVKSGNYDSAKTIAEMIRPTSKNSNTSDSYR